MNDVLIEKVVVSMGVGPEPERMKRAVQIIESITGRKAIKTFSEKRIPLWGVRPGVPLGLKITLRKQPAMDFLKRCLYAKENKIAKKSFDNNGNFAFGVKEQIDLQGVKYDPKLGIMGFDVLVSLQKKGYRIKRRKIQQSVVGKAQRVTKEEAQEFVKSIGVELNE
ncbi:MAG: 50S ribosomal protein L5 [Candidatus ainarchaeum sp.]|nr:50S ribosomal protein L5 [Candidatus ainarchaeum sp.]